MDKNEENDRWIVCQIGAREVYSIPRALHQAGKLELLLTDIWIKPDGLPGWLLGKRSTFERWHADLADAQILAPSGRSLWFEFVQYLNSREGMIRDKARNQAFQKNVLELLKKRNFAQEGIPRTLFAFSYAARDLFLYAKSRGWRTVLGQIDPGPEEENLVMAEHKRYPQSGSRWHPAGDSYWDMWREETELADRIIVNSEWARRGLLKAGITDDKIEIIPLICDGKKSTEGEACGSDVDSGPIVSDANGGNLHVLFLGNVCLRKGIGRLVEAMRMLHDQPIDLTICGHLDVSQAMWSGLPNIRWMAPVRNTSVDGAYRAADVFILPTISDGFARTQIEAMEQGTPVIASLNCGNVVLDGVNGYRLLENSPEEIAALLFRICRDRSILSKLKMVVRAESMPATLAELEDLLVRSKIGFCVERTEVDSPSDVGNSFLRRKKHRLLPVGKVVLLLALSFLIYFFLWADWPNPQLSELPEHADLVLVLGGEDDQRPKTAVRIFEQGKADIIAVTGDGGQIVTKLKELGVPDAAVWHEDNAKSTIDNAKFAAPFIQKADARKVIVVTCWFHANRALKVFEDRYPAIEFDVAFEPRKSGLSKWEREHQRRERFAALVYLFRYGIWCF